MPRLKETDIQEQLKTVNGWEQTGDEIKKKFSLPTFPAAVGFVNAVAVLAEKANHHPDFLIQYRNVTLTLTTYSQDGLTEKDFDLAREIDKLV
jgi:4a-hydroxytetrahydrobiopterin dehydratase